MISQTGLENEIKTLKEKVEDLQTRLYREQCAHDRTVQSWQEDEEAWNEKLDALQSRVDYAEARVDELREELSNKDDSDFLRDAELHELREKLKGTVITDDPATYPPHNAEVIYFCTVDEKFTSGIIRFCPDSALPWNGVKWWSGTRWWPLPAETQ